MKKFLSVALLIIMTVSMLSSCHGSKKIQRFEVPENFDTSKNYEITFWAKNDTNKAQTNVYNKAVEDFQKLYPNIKVTIRLYTDYLRIYNDVITNIPTNTTPNVCITYPDHIATYITGENTVVPLNELFKDDKYGFGGSELKYDSPSRDELVPEFINECIIGDTYYAVPFMRSTEACYINKTFVEKLGYTIPEVLTWDFVWEVSEAAMKKNSDGTYAVNGQNVMIPFIYKSTDNMMISMLKQLNAPYSTATGEINIFNETTKGLLETIASHTKNGAFSTFKISGYPANFLNKGQCIFAVDSTAGSTWMGSKAPLSDIDEGSIVEFETQVMTIPQFNESNTQMISQGPSICIFNKDDPDEVLASWLFTQYLLTNDVQIGYSKTEGYLPVTTKAHSDSEYQDYLSRGGENNKEYYQVKIDATNLLLSNLENTFVTPVFNGSTSLREAAGAIIESTCKSVRRNETIGDEYYENLFADTKTLYRLDSLELSDGKAKLGEMPVTSIILLSCIGAAWVAIGGFVLASSIKKKSNRV